LPAAVGMNNSAAPDCSEHVCDEFDVFIRLKHETFRPVERVSTSFGKGDTV